MARKKGVSTVSGIRRVSIRMPTPIHEALLQRREETGQSLNDLVIEAAAKLLGVPVPAVPKGIPGPKPKKQEMREKR